MVIPQPQLAYRSWVLYYDRPRRMGWPNLARTGWEGHREPQWIAPRRIRIEVQQRASGLPTVTAVTVSGKWAGTSLDVTNERIRIDSPRPGLAFTVYPPDWVADLCVDAVCRAEQDLPG